MSSAAAASAASGGTEFERVHRAVKDIERNNPKAVMPLLSKLLTTHPLFQHFLTRSPDKHIYPFSVYGGLLREEIQWNLEGLSLEQRREKFLKYLDPSRGGNGDLDLWYDNSEPLDIILLEISEYSFSSSEKLNLRNESTLNQRGNEHYRSWRNDLQILEICTTTRYELDKQLREKAEDELLEEYGYNDYLYLEDVIGRTRCRDLVGNRVAEMREKVARTFTFTVQVIKDLLWEGQDEFELRVDFTICPKLNELNLDLDINSLVWRRIYTDQSVVDYPLIESVTNIDLHQIVRNLMKRRFRIICSQMKEDSERSKMLYRVVKSLVRGYSPQFDDYNKIMLLAATGPESNVSEYIQTYTQEHYHLLLEWIFRLGPDATEDYISRENCIIYLFNTYSRLKRYNRIRELISKYGTQIYFDDYYELQHLVFKSGKISLVRELDQAIDQRDTEQSLRKYSVDRRLFKSVVIGDNLDVLHYMLTQKFAGRPLTIEDFLEIGEWLVYRTPMFRILVDLLPIAEKATLVGNQNRMHTLISGAQLAQNPEVIGVLRREFKIKCIHSLPKPIPGKFVKVSILDDHSELQHTISEERTLACQELIFNSFSDSKEQQLDYLLDIASKVVYPNYWIEGLKWALSHGYSDHKFYLSQMQNILRFGLYLQPHLHDILLSEDIITFLICYLNRHWSPELNTSVMQLFDETNNRLRGRSPNDSRTIFFKQLRQSYDQLVAEKKAASVES